MNRLPMLFVYHHTRPTTTSTLLRLGYCSTYRVPRMLLPPAAGSWKLYSVCHRFLQCRLLAPVSCFTYTATGLRSQESFILPTGNFSPRGSITCTRLTNNISTSFMTRVVMNDMAMLLQYSYHAFFFSFLVTLRKPFILHYILLTTSTSLCYYCIPYCGWSSFRLPNVWRG